MDAQRGCAARRHCNYRRGDHTLHSDTYWRGNPIVEPMDIDRFPIALTIPDHTLNRVVSAVYTTQPRPTAYALGDGRNTLTDSRPACGQGQAAVVRRQGTAGADPAAGEAATGAVLDPNCGPAGCRCPRTQIGCDLRWHRAFSAALVTFQAPSNTCRLRPSLEAGFRRCARRSRG
ncbi:hypothetical protein BN6_19530 [Saccharothrix espanaensis DSM 44229]|uniref:Uncharacterized protein n=1 Tax=Saccharothrix espanaensis (strain ATCC 51144 / DSM 44229 / JCM 9112 / NBRC 15066 / NRRL 15764) TaxID=1179773 RepID=K0JUS9_SACES|nr:hypothetical protein BN6_19530 [Saccharothrix espanaensis DSM 44229]